MIQVADSGEDAMDMLEETGLADRADNFPAQLSGGESSNASPSLGPLLASLNFYYAMSLRHHLIRRQQQKF